MASIISDKLLQKLEEIPCSFNLKIKGITQRQGKILLEKLQREFECQEYEHSEEKRRYYNLMTYLHYFCRQLNAALQCNNAALQMDAESIVALGNQAWISYKENSRDEDCQEIDKIIKMVLKLRSNRVKLLEAKAEIAYSYARFGMMYYEKAQTLYQNVLAEVKENDTLPSFLWQYGCGLILRRKLRFHGERKVYETELKQAADLLYNVAKQDKIIRFKSRAWAEIGNLAFYAKKRCVNWQKLFPKEINHISVDKMFSMAAESNIHVNDVPALEQCANYLKKRGQNEICAQILQQTIVVKQSSRAYQWLAHLKMIKYLLKMKRMKEWPTQESPTCINYCKETQEIVLLYDTAINLQQNITAMECKAKFLYRIGHFKDAIDVFHNIYCLLQTTDTQPQDIDRIIQVFCQVYHAKCILGLSRDESAITQAKDLIRSAIEMSFDFQGKSRAEARRECYRILPDCKIDDNSSKDEDELPRMRNLQNIALAEMKYLLQNGERTTEFIVEEIALCELIKDDDRAIQLWTEIAGRMIDIEKPIDIAEELINNKEFDKGLFLLKQNIICGKLPAEMKGFTIKAQLDGAMNALEKDDSVLARTRFLDAFNFRFLDQDTTNRDMLHIFFLAHEYNKDLTWKLQQSFDEMTKLKITSCFDTTPGSSQVENLDDNLHKSYIIAVLMDKTDLENDDFATEFFKTSIRKAQCTQMKHIRTKALVAVKLSEQVAISFLLGDTPHVQLGNDFQQDKNKFMHEFFLKALLN
ncbi:hypothetical protein CHS0354_035487 [Potamilus streckersoni]|uniref:Uncharacterized protein n=1 Tax=Potamilus streckersoni TaxID=2493646 RepID=A0AAE0RVV2_9BIVA|nr:hypothetical protein CHS0354_035487 [Potamilus streckersoni]